MPMNSGKPLLLLPNIEMTDDIDLSECLMVDSRTFHLIVGNHLVMEFEVVLVDNSLGKKYSWSLPWSVYRIVECWIIADVQIFQSFDIRPHNPDYKLQIKHTITLKPKDFYMQVSARKDRDIPTIIGSGAQQVVNKGLNGKDGAKGSDGNLDLSVYYGNFTSAIYVIQLTIRK